MCPFHAVLELDVDVHLKLALNDAADSQSKVLPKNKKQARDFYVCNSNVLQDSKHCMDLEESDILEGHDERLISGWKSGKCRQ